MMEDLHKQLDALVEQETNKRVGEVLDGLLLYIAELRKKYGPASLPSTPVVTSGPEISGPHPQPIATEKTTDVTGEQNKRGEAQRARREAEAADALDHTPNKVCIICGTHFYSAYHNAKLCSDECRAKQYELYKKSKLSKHSPEEIKELRRQTVNNARKERLAAKKKEATKHSCVWCGRPTTKSVYCSENCRKAKENVLRDKLDIPKPESEQKPKTKSCIVCGQPIPITRGNTKMCSDTCRRERARLYMAKRRKQEVEDNEVIFFSHRDEDLVDKDYYDRELAKSNERLAKRLMPSPPSNDDPEKVAAAIAKVREENSDIGTNTRYRVLQSWRAEHRKKQAKKWPEPLSPIK